MKKQSPRQKGIPPRPGTLVFGPARESGDGRPSYFRLFRCRKDGFDFMGQLRIESEPASLHVEVFNENYFDLFQVPRDRVVPSLERKILSRLLADRTCPAGFKAIARTLSPERAVLKESPSAVVPVGEGEIDLREIFDRLNAEYFDGKITARVEWGRKVNGRNLTSFRFGSYDPEKKLIRVHSRLQLPFVPRSVLELTVFHEMCHEWAPMRRKKGMWLAHHPKFKEKERQYRFYEEAHAWEKENWKKLLGPSAKKRAKKESGIPEIALAAG